MRAESVSVENPFNSADNNSPHAPRISLKQKFSRSAYQRICYDMRTGKVVVSMLTENSFVHLRVYIISNHFEINASDMFRNVTFTISFGPVSWKIIRVHTRIC